MRAEPIADLCPTCQGTGWEPVEESGCAAVPVGREAARGPRAAGLVRGGLVKSLPVAAVNAGILRDTVAWLESPAPRPDLYLHGPTGTGKTTLAAMLRQ